GRDLFVANGYGGNSLTELSASTGKLVRVLSGSSYRFNYPDALALSGGYLFVANGAGRSVTELNASTGKLVRVISGSSYRFIGPDALAVSSGDLFVANAFGSS